MVNFLGCFEKSLNGKECNDGFINIIQIKLFYVFLYFWLSHLTHLKELVIIYILSSPSKNYVFYNLLFTYQTRRLKVIRSFKELKLDKIQPQEICNVHSVNMFELWLV